MTKLAFCLCLGSILAAQGFTAPRATEQFDIFAGAQKQFVTGFDPAVAFGGTVRKAFNSYVAGYGSFAFSPEQRIYGNSQGTPYGLKVSLIDYHFGADIHTASRTAPYWTIGVGGIRRWATLAQPTVEASDAANAWLGSSGVGVRHYLNRHVGVMAEVRGMRVLRGDGSWFGRASVGIFVQLPRERWW